MLSLYCSTLFIRGSAIAKILGANVKTDDQFDSVVNMWVFEEMVDGKKLTEIINETHENVKYLPKHIIPDSVVSLMYQVPGGGRGGIKLLLKTSVGTLTQESTSHN